MSQKIYCLAQFEPKPGHEDELFNTLKSLEEETHKEEGCIQYVVTKKCENQYATGQSKLFVFNEIWRSQEDFEQHCQRKEIVEFFEKHCLSEDRLVKSYNVCTYTDEN
jgi:quinol monooxygenase YgiN